MIAELTIFVVYLSAIRAGIIKESLLTALPPSLPNFSEDVFNQSRRILRGHDVGHNRPYMVYLIRSRPSETTSSTERQPDPNWTCGGVIVHAQYIMTSAACVEDVKQFYVISGTNKWTPANSPNECVENGGKKAVWKCVPKTYVYDGNDIDNIRWMYNDIAIVKVQDSFNFEKRVRGCDFIPRIVAYNNISESYEKPGTIGSVVGWGFNNTYEESADIYNTPVLKSAKSLNSEFLLESDIKIISKSNCKKRWPERYHYIIDDKMICTKDSMGEMSTACTEEHVNCKELVYSDAEEETRRMLVPDPNTLQVHSPWHYDDNRRSRMIYGGFCENDHGGPLVVGQGMSAIVIGIITASQYQPITRKCYGPFLYTSVYKNRHLINCAINKELEMQCRRVLKSMNTKLHETALL